MTVAGVLLAAGGGTRFTGPEHKLRAGLAGRMVVEWSLAAMLAASLDEVLVVTGAVDLSDVLPDGVLQVQNPRWSEGQATSLAAAVDVLTPSRHDAMVVGLADQPGVGPECWNAVAASTSPLARATYDGRWGHPARVGREMWAAIDRDGDAGARGLFAGRPGEVEAVPCRGRLDDIDTLEDLARWN